MSILNCHSEFFLHKILLNFKNILSSKFTITFSAVYISNFTVILHKILRQLFFLQIMNDIQFKAENIFFLNGIAADRSNVQIVERGKSY